MDEEKSDFPKFQDLFDLDEIQRIQDAFATATGVASIITDPEGTPITKPSNFCKLCKNIIRGTKKGLTNCMKSDSILGRHNPDGPIIQKCLSGGLWDGGASITVGEHHIASWLIGQVMNESVDTAEMIQYAKKIGADEESFKKALGEVNVMPIEQFKSIAHTLFLMANLMSNLAYQNLQQKKYIEERKRLQQELIQTQKMKAIGTLAGGIAHDFNNILTIIMGNSSMLRQELKGDEEIEYIDQIIEASDHGKELVEQILTFSRQDENTTYSLYLHEILEDSLKFLHSSLPSSIEIISSIPKIPKPIIANATQIQQLIFNISTNASHAMKSQGTLEVKLREIYIETSQNIHNVAPGNYLRLLIKDNGPGIEKSIQRKIFEPFFTTKDVGEGTGMGLSVVHGIVKKLGGSIAIESERGEGAQFYIYFPIGDEQVIRGKKEIAVIPRGNESILFVDDEKMLAKMGKKC